MLHRRVVLVGLPSCHGEGSDIDVDETIWPLCEDGNCRCGVTDVADDVTQFHRHGRLVLPLH